MLPPFDLSQPQSLADALQALAGNGDTRPLAGATNLVPDLRGKRETCRDFVSLEALDELRYIKRDGDRVTLGARTTMADILDDRGIKTDAPALYAAAEIFAGSMVRTAATIGGNICCGSPSADTVPALLTVDAEITLSSASGERTVSLDNFYTDYKKSVMRSDELLTSVSWNVPSQNSANLFYKLARRKGDAITVTGVAVMITAGDGVCSSARIALGSVAPTVFRASAAENLLAGKALDEGIIEQAASAAADQCAPIDDIRASADYRLQTAFSLTRRLLTQAWRQVS
ncbi:MAG: xanthine dehydrogenase family protein subunit M [Gammaproteobacteria bacterium]|nr:xanthine dehydrogenase family protein subunit M [Gammaproteobacteria bacterium]